MKKTILLFLSFSLLMILSIGLSACLRRTPNKSPVYFTVSYCADNGGTISGDKLQTVKEAEDATSVTAVPNIGYKFVAWTDGVETAERIDMAITADKSVKAIFEKEIFTVCYMSEEGGYIDGEYVQGIEYGKNALPVVAIAKTGYKFIEWSDGIETAERIDLNIKSDKTVKAVFDKKIYSLEYKPTEGGLIYPNDIQYARYGETGTPVHAVPYNGYEFLKWSDGKVEQIRKDCDITSDISITAIFVKKQFNVTFLAAEGGAIEGEASQTVLFGENSKEVVAAPNEGYRFVRWSDGRSLDPIRSIENVTENIIVTAQFEKIYLKATYSCLGHGSLTGELSQNLDWNGTTDKVTAIPENGYVFIGWSDGVTTPERIDKNLKSDLYVIAYFGYSATYKVNNNEGGKIVGQIYQAVKPDEDFLQVTAVPEEGYVFCGWSDKNMCMKRQDISAKRNVEYMAYFEPIEKTFYFDFGEYYNAPLENRITLNRNNLKESDFIIPQTEGYKFCGWYADKNYRLKVVNENGVYMLGYKGLTLGTDTLYAKWESEDKQNFEPYKILIVVVDEIKATLYSSITETNFDIDYKLTAIEREMCSVTADKVYEYLNKWFDGKVSFEVDIYYTLDTVMSDSFDFGLNGSGERSYRLMPNDMSELNNLNCLYHSVLSLYNLNDNENIVSLASGVSRIKYGAVTLDKAFLYAESYLPYHLFVEMIKNDEIDMSQTIIDTVLHEFAHTCECCYKSGEIAEFHKVLFHYLSDIGIPSQAGEATLEPIKLYLLGEAELDGMLCGIPMEYWLHKHAVIATYDSSVIDFETVGKVVLLEGNGIISGLDDYSTTISVEITYGTHMKVEAIPKEGYRFVKWSDGVTTAIRQDSNIISYFSVKAIFEEIN